MSRKKYVKMQPSLALWEIIDQFGVKGYLQTMGFLVIVPALEYVRILDEAKDKPQIVNKIQSLTKKEAR